MTTTKHLLPGLLMGAAALANAQPSPGVSGADGKALYAKSCAACHQPTGAGIAGAFPPLKGSRFVQGDATAVITTVLKGRGGMPTFATSLDDDKLAQVISYVRQTWGNQAGAVSAQDVQAVRSATGSQDAAKQDKPTNIH